MKKQLYLAACLFLFGPSFAVEDNEDNILFDDVELGKPSGGPGPPIKAGTIHKLVERLTYHEYAGEWIALAVLKEGKARGAL